MERKLKDAVEDDRARIQIGRISQFGLMEMSRQRLRPSLVEATTERCAVCGGTGHVRSVETTALQVLRAIEDHALKGKSAAISVAVSTRVALYLLNHSRRAITDIEAAHGMTIEVTGDDRLANATFRIDVTRVRQPGEGPDPEERRRELEARAAARKAEEQEEDEIGRAHV